jgi:hypothetical protein
MFVPDLEEVIRDAPRQVARLGVYRTHADNAARHAEERRGELVESLACLFNAAMDDDGFSSLITNVVEATTNDIIDRRAHGDLEVFIDERIENSGDRGSPQSHQHEVDISIDMGDLGSFDETVTSSPADE